MYRGRKGFKVKYRPKPVAALDFLKYEGRIENFSHSSQLGQDGVIEELFNRIGSTNKFFVEFGARMPWQLNSAYLRKRKGWKGLLMDASDPEFNWRRALRCNKNYRRMNHPLRSNSLTEAQIAENWKKIPMEEFDLVKKNVHLTRDNINDVFLSHDVPAKFDLLTIDIDGQDWWVWKGLDETKFKPRVVCIEFDFSLGSEVSIVQPYNPDSTGDFCSCSLKALEKLAELKGYSYVYSLSPHKVVHHTKRFTRYRLAGTHAFFVLNEELNDECRKSELREYKSFGSHYRYRLNLNDCPFMEV